ncbi:MAG: CHAD domain-containing protein [Gemmatimonadetes bacterium]|nr:CHAD domain-containing protein [Gemmatimonadota bacterium]
MANAPLTRESLRLPARHAVRDVARGRLQRVLDQAARLEAAEAALSADPLIAEPYAADAEAVHDFRVAIRRLRSWMRAFHPFLEDTVKPATEKRLRRLARVAGRARDLEVQSHWLRTLPSNTPPMALEAARWLLARNDAAYAVARRKLAREVHDDLPKIAAKLGEQLRHYLLDIDVDAPARERPFGAVMGPLLREHRSRVSAKLTEVRTREQLAAVHAARIEVKRLRYLLETLDDVSRAAKTHGRRLSLLQDVFGELHDAQVLQERVAEQLSASARRGVRARGAPTPDATGNAAAPGRRAWLALQRRLARRSKSDAGRALRAAHSSATQRTLAAVDTVAQRLERAR